jgi:hypothetical protein
LKSVKTSLYFWLSAPSTPLSPPFPSLWSTLAQFAVPIGRSETSCVWWFSLFSSSVEGRRARREIYWCLISTQEN